jgi:hypothetical protein
MVDKKLSEKGAPKRCAIGSHVFFVKLHMSVNGVDNSGLQAKQQAKDQFWASSQAAGEGSILGFKPSSRRRIK